MSRYIFLMVALLGFANIAIADSRALFELEFLPSSDQLDPRQNHDLKELQGLLRVFGHMRQVTFGLETAGNMTIGRYDAVRKALRVRGRDDRFRQMRNRSLDANTVRVLLITPDSRDLSCPWQMTARFSRNLSATVPLVKGETIYINNDVRLTFKPKVQAPYENVSIRPQQQRDFLPFDPRQPVVPGVLSLLVAERNPATASRNVQDRPDSSRPAREIRCNLKIRTQVGG